MSWKDGNCYFVEARSHFITNLSNNIQTQTNPQVYSSSHFWDKKDSKQDYSLNSNLLADICMPKQSK